MNQAQPTIAQTLYFLSFGTLWGRPYVKEATVEQTEHGYKLVTQSAGFDEITRQFQPITEVLEAFLKLSGFVEVPDSAYYAAIFKPWELYEYKQFLAMQGSTVSDAYIKALIEWSANDGAPTVQHVDPLTHEEKIALLRAKVRTVRTPNGIVDNVLIFPYLNEVIAGLTAHKRLMPWWNSVACQGKQMPVTIGVLELEQYAPYMARIGTNESGAVISYVATEADD